LAEKAHLLAVKLAVIKVCQQKKPVKSQLKSYKPELHKLRMCLIKITTGY